MPRINGVRAQDKSTLEKSAELDLLVAHYIGIRRTTEPILGYHIVRHTLFILALKINCDKRNIEMCRYTHSITALLAPRTFGPLRLPCFNKRTHHLHASTPKQHSRNSRVHTTR